MARYWTLAEAREALPEAVALLTQLQTLLREHAESRAQQAPSGAGGAVRSVNGHGSASGPTRFEEEARRVLQRMDELGVQVKDVETGLLDFPHLRDGEEVLLCYRLGEPDILFWHDLQSGFAGRRPISEL
jgi:hypothetical protein